MKLGHEEAMKVLGDVGKTCRDSVMRHVKEFCYEVPHECTVEECRTKPRGINDWRAVNNLMGLAHYNARHYGTSYQVRLTAFVVAISKGELQLDDTQEILADATISTAFNLVLDAHWELMSRFGQEGGMADLHYDRIYSMCETLAREQERRASTPKDARELVENFLANAPKTKRYNRHDKD